MNSIKEILCYILDNVKKIGVNVNLSLKFIKELLRYILHQFEKGSFEKKKVKEKQYIFFKLLSICDSCIVHDGF